MSDRRPTGGRGHGVVLIQRSLQDKGEEARDYYSAREERSVGERLCSRRPAAAYDTQLATGRRAPEGIGS